MTKCILTAATLIVSFVGLFGVNALRVTKDEVKTGLTEMLPTEFRQKLSEQEIAKQGTALAEVAVTVDRDVLPRYAAFLPGTSFSDLQKDDLRPFRSMVANLDAASEKLSALRCLSESGTDFASKKLKLEQLADRARADLKMMEDLNARVQELNELAASLANAVGSLSISEGPPALSVNRLDSVKEFITECERKMSVERYEIEFQSRLNGGMSQAETEELKALMQTLEVASN